MLLQYNKANTAIVIKFLATITLLFFLVGCTKVYKADFLKTYKKYLEYSLGEYKVEERIVETCPGPIPEVSRYTEWRLFYKDSSGIDQVLILNNTTDKDADKDNKMGCQVYTHAGKICSDEVGTRICSKFFDYISDESKVPKESLPVTYCVVKSSSSVPFTDSDYKYCIDDEVGLKLNSITAKAFIDQWKGVLEVSVMTAETHDKAIGDIIARTESLLKDYSTYLNLDIVAATINNSPYDQLYKVVYDRKNADFDVVDTKIIETRISGKDKAHDEQMEIIDGHIGYIGEYVVNGRRLAWLDGTYYDNEKKTYFLGSYLALLKALGVPLHKTNVKGAYVYNWQIGNDSFEAYDSYPEKILKNSREIIIPKSSNPSGGITIKDFESISGATVVVDEVKEVVIIESK